MGFFNYSIKRLLESIKIKENSLRALGLQILVLVSIVGVFLLYLFFGVIPFVDNIQQYQDPATILANLEDPSEIDQDEIDQQLSLYNWFIFQTILVVVGAFTLFIFLTYFLWKCIRGSRFKWKSLFKHVLVNISIFIFIFIVGFLFSVILQSWILPFFVVFVLLPLYIHLSTLLNSSLEKKPLDNFLNYGIKKIHYFIFSHVIIFAVGVIVFGISMIGLNLMLHLQVIESNVIFFTLVFISFFILIFIISLYLLWAKKYVFVLFKGLKKG